MSLRSTLPALSLALLLAAPAAAAPVAATATLTIQLTGVAAGTFTASGLVDVTGGVITVPAGLVAATMPLVVPVTGSTTLSDLSFVGVSNLTGVFALGGVTAQAPGEICPGGATAGGAGGLACNVGGGLGGVMGLTGTLNVNVVPGIVVVPVPLNSLLLGQGGSTNGPFIADAAAWTTGTGLLNTGVDVFAYSGFSTGDTLQLVSPLFATACGNILPIISTLTLSLVPEPAAWVSLWLGVLGIVVLTRRR